MTARPTATGKREKRGGKAVVPTMLKKLRGTLHPERERDKYEPSPEINLPLEPPHWFSDDQQLSWRHAITNAPPGLLKNLDQGTLVAWCVAESKHRQAVQAQNRLDRDAEWPFLVAPAQDGGKTMHLSPYVALIERASLEMARLAMMLGFSPAARPRIQLIPGLPPAPIIDAQLDAWGSMEALHERG